MSNEFKWTDELVLEFLLERLNTGISFDDFKAKQVNKGFADWVPDFLKRAEQPKQVKGWEVQSYKWNGSEFVYYREGNGVPDKFYMRKGGGHEGSAAWLMQQGATIHSVKRLSDGEVFTVGKDFTYLDKPVNIKSFEANNGSMMAWINGMERINIEYLKHKRTSLFTTYDGKEVFEGDTYFNLLEHDFTIKEVNNASHLSGRVKALKYFSTRAAAEEYVKLHQPKYSLTDFQTAYSAPLDSPLWNETVEKLMNIEKYRVK